MGAGFDWTCGVFDELRNSTLATALRALRDAGLERAFPPLATATFAAFFLETLDLRARNDFFATLLAGLDIDFTLCLVFAAITRLTKILRKWNLYEIAACKVKLA